MEFLKKMPATIVLMVVNIAVFAWMYFNYDTPDQNLWWSTLLNHGALYNPLTLDGQWQRIFTHMFQHGHIYHLLFNMYALFSVGRDIEPHVGTTKFILVYFIGGFAAALCSLYFSLFTVGVGASGAIFALFGFALIININRYREQLVPLIINFLVFLVMNYIVAGFVNADNAAHFGGAFCGVFMGILSITIKKKYIPEAALASILIITFLLLPRYQVHYFKFFQKVLEAQDSSNYVLNHSGSKSNEQFLKEYRRANAKWDTAMALLNAQQYIPVELQSDTFKLRRMLRYNKAEGSYRSIMVENESYIYADSIGIATDSAGKYRKLDFVLNLKYAPPDTSDRKPQGPPLEDVRIWYDTNWVELPYPPAAYFRAGQRDSAGLWQGPLVDYFRTGIAQMKGSYKDDMKDGIFIYYNSKGGYSAAGVYNDDQRIGKWETFHPNGQIETEVYYRERYFIKSLWDSTGVQMVKDGYGKEIHHYPNGVIASEGEYVDGYQEGYWYGRHENGQMYFEENYNRGRLINGRSRSKNGRTAVYDETIFYALPEGGLRKYGDYIRSQVKDPVGLGTVKLSFRVTVASQITDFKVEQSVSKELDLRAKQLVLSGPKWLPARLHGLEPADGWGFVSVDF